jgi:O-antigen/teichoic acid export membrane protein
MTVLASSAVGAPIGVLTSAVLARWLSEQDFGYYGLAARFTALGLIVAQLGLPTASIYRMRRLGLVPGRVAAAALVSVVVLSLAIASLAFALSGPLVQNFMAGAPAGVFALAVLAIPVQLTGAVFTGLARGIDRFDVQLYFRLALMLGTLGAVVIALVVLGGGVLEALVAVLAVRVAAATGLVARVLRETGMGPRPPLRDFPETARFGLKSWTQNLAGILHESTVDVFLLSYLLRDPAQVAYYVVAVTLSAQLRLLPEGVASALFPELSGVPPERAGTLVAGALRHCLLWVVLASALLALAIPPLLPLIWGAPYAASVAPALILLPGTVALTAFRLVARYFVAFDRQGVTIAARFAGLALNVALNWILIPRYGVVGAAAASLLSYGLEAALGLGAFMRASGTRLDALVFRASDLELYRARLAPALRRIRKGG